MTDYFRTVRCDYLEDMSLSPDAFRVLAYMVAQREGFTFNLENLQRVFRSMIGRNRIKAARAELIAAGYLRPGRKRHRNGRLSQDGATVNWRKVVFSQVDRRTENRASSNRAASIRADITIDEVTKNELTNRPAPAGVANTSEAKLAEPPAKAGPVADNPWADYEPPGSGAPPPGVSASPSGGSVCDTSVECTSGADLVSVDDSSGGSVSDTSVECASPDLVTSAEDSASSDLRSTDGHSATDDLESFIDDPWADETSDLSEWHQGFEARQRKRAERKARRSLSEQ